MKQMAICGQ